MRDQPHRRRIVKSLYNNLKNFYDPDVPYYAASLSFYTLFTLIPLLLVSLSIFVRLPSFANQYEKIKNFIFSNIMPTSHEMVERYIDTFLANATKLGTIGFVFIIVASIMFFQNYEYIVAKIFKTRQKNFWNALATYWTMITLGPILLAASIYLSLKLQQLLDSTRYTNGIDFLAIFPYLIVWGLFFIIYKISTTIEINLKAAALSSFIASLIWYMGKSLFIFYTLHTKTYTTIYGSMSVMMFFMLWIYVSWIIFLYGQKLCYLLNQYYQKAACHQKSENGCRFEPGGQKTQQPKTNPKP